MQTSAIIHNCEYIKRELQYRSGAIKLKADLLKKFCRSGPKSRLFILNTSMDQSVKEFNIILLKGHITKQDFFVCMEFYLKTQNNHFLNSIPFSF